MDLLHDGALGLLGCVPGGSCISGAPSWSEVAPLPMRHGPMHAVRAREVSTVGLHHSSDTRDRRAKAHMGVAAACPQAAESPDPTDPTYGIMDGRRDALPDVHPVCASGSSSGRDTPEP